MKEKAAKYLAAALESAEREGIKKGIQWTLAKLGTKAIGDFPHGERFIESFMVIRDAALKEGLIEDVH